MILPQALAKHHPIPHPTLQPDPFHPLYSLSALPLLPPPYLCPSPSPCAGHLVTTPPHTLCFVSLRPSNSWSQLAADLHFMFKWKISIFFFFLGIDSRKWLSNVFSPSVITKHIATEITQKVCMKHGYNILKLTSISCLQRSTVSQKWHLPNRKHWLNLPS